MKSKVAKLEISDRTTRLGRYCAAGAGAAVLAGTVTTADAGIVFINFNNEVFSDTTPQDGIATLFTAGAAGNFDFNGDGTIDFQLAQRDYFARYGRHYNLAGFVAPVGGNIDVIGFVGASLRYPSRLAAGTMIGAGGAFVTLASGASGVLASLSLSRMGMPQSQWLSFTGPSEGFLGISFSAGGQTYFGWVGLSVAGRDAAIPYAITLTGFAYEDTPGTAIAAGDMGAPIPEPASLALVALGGIGLLAYRRRRATQAV